MKSNILCIVIDSLKSDSLYGESKKSITPYFDNLIKNGTLFTRAVPCAPTTIPSISSILTSKFPFECMIKNDIFFTLDPSEKTYIHHFIENGYNAYSNNLKLVQYLGLKKYFNIISNDYKESKALHLELGENIVNKIKNNKFQEPWIAYFHIYDLHEAESIEIFNEKKFGIDEKSGRNNYEKILTSLDKWIEKIIENVDFKNTILVVTADHSTNKAVFDEEIEKFSDNLEKMYNVKISERKTSILPKKLIQLKKKFTKKNLEKRRDDIESKNAKIIDEIKRSSMSNYKKRVLESRIKEVYNVFDDRFNIPLLFVGKNIPKKIITQQVRTIDIFPTIAELSGLDSKTDVRGQSLIPLMKNVEIQEEPAFIESAVNSSLIPTAHTIGIRTSNYKYFRDRNNPKENVHLFDLKNDPLEEKNIAKENLEIIKEMEKHLKKIRGENTFNFKVMEEVFSKEESSDALKILKELGYVK